MKRLIKVVLRKNTKSAITGIVLPGGKTLRGYEEGGKYFVYVPGTNKYAAVQIENPLSVEFTE